MEARVRRNCGCGRPSVILQTPQVSIRPQICATTTLQCTEVDRNKGRESQKKKKEKKKRETPSSSYVVSDFTGSPCALFICCHSNLLPLFVISCCSVFSL